MKSFVVFCTLVVAVLGKDYVVKTSEDLGHYRTECWDKFNLSNDLRESVKKFEYPDVEPMHKYIRCVCELTGTWDEKDGFNVDLMAKQFGDDKRPIVEKCNTKRTPDWTIEKWVWSDWSCMVKSGLIPKVN